MNSTTIVLAFLPYLVLFLLSLVFIISGCWLLAWVGILCKLPRAFGRFAAEVVKEYRASIGD